MNTFSSRADWLATLPQKRSASGALFFNAQNEVLILEPRVQIYQIGWGFPGGMIELNESPHETAQRETLEELGLNVTIGSLLCIDYVPHYIDDATHDSYQMIFDGGVLSDEQIAAICLQPEEIITYRFVDPADALTLLKPDRVQRVRMALQARTAKTTYYLEHGQRI